MGNTASTEENQRWVLEKVLFFDPETRPDPDEAFQVRGSAGCVKRFTPSNAKLCNRNFLIGLQIEGKKREFILKLQNQPSCRMLLCDKSGEPLKEIRTTRIKYVQRQNMTVEVYVKTERNETSSLSFEFENAKECDLFAEFLKMLFGIQVHHFGFRDMSHGNKNMLENADLVSSSDWSDSDEDDFDKRRRAQERERRQRQQALQRRTGCPLHGDQPCRCTIDRPSIAQYDDASASSEDEIAARQSNKFPVAIDGLCESGGVLKMKDLAARVLNKAPPRVVEWFFSHEPGKDVSFSTVPEKTGLSTRVEEKYVGYSVQIRVARRIEGTTAANPFVYSVAFKGPITVNSETARRMLEILSEVETPLDVTMANADLHTLFELPPKSVEDTKPFFDCTLTLTRSGVSFSARVREYSTALERTMRWENFCVTRPEADELDYREDDITMIFHVLNFSAQAGAYEVQSVTMRLPSESIRNAVFHTIIFFRLQKRVMPFERFSRDLEMGNFTLIKQLYARLWADNSWTDYVTLTPPSARSPRPPPVTRPLSSSPARHAASPAQARPPRQQTWRAPPPQAIALEAHAPETIPAPAAAGDDEVQSQELEALAAEPDAGAAAADTPSLAPPPPAGAAGRRAGKPPPPKRDYNYFAQVYAQGSSIQNSGIFDVNPNPKKP